MVESKLLKRIQKDFADVDKIRDILGILLYGSHVYGKETPRSDVDICIVAPNWDKKELYRRISTTLRIDPEIYDVRFYEELPLSIRGQIIEDGLVVYSPDKPALYEFFYFNGRKEWEDLKYRRSHV